MSSIMITGASSGIGHACVSAAVARGWHVFATVRRNNDVDALTQQFGSAVTPIIMDVCDDASIVRAADTVAQHLGNTTLGGLVNNAGVAVAGPSMHIPMAEFRQQFDINFFGQIAVTQAIAPLLGMDQQRHGTPGRIVNMSSLGGKIGAPYLAPYVASKHALEGWSESLRRELLMFGIDVIVVGPGAIATPIWQKAESLNVTQYAHTAYAPYITRYHAALMRTGIHGLPAAQVGNLVMHIMTTSRPRTRYMLAPNPLINWWLPRLLPIRWVDRIVARAYGLPAAPTQTPTPHERHGG